MAKEHGSLAGMKSKSDSTIIKHRHERYTTLPREVTNGDTGLSLRAIGLLAYLIGMPDDWKTWSRAIAKRFKCSRRVVLTTLRELRQAGHAKLDFAERDAEGRGAGRVWRISTDPEFRIQTETNRNAPKVELRSKPNFGKSRSSVKAEVREKEPIQNSNLGQSTNGEQKTNKKLQTTNGGAASPTPPGRNGHCSISPSQSESLNRAIQFEELPIGEQLTQVWQAKYQRWHGTTYRVKGADAQSIDEFCSGGPSQQDMTALMHTAMAAWVDTAKAPVRPAANQHDQYFYRRRSDKLGFVIRNLVSLQAEMEQAQITMYGESVVGTIVLQGKQAYLSNGS